MRLPQTLDGGRRPFVNSSFKNISIKGAGSEWLLGNNDWGQYVTY